MDDLLISQPDYGEEALEIAELVVRSRAVDLVVIDSVAALAPKAEITGNMGDSHVGLQARLMSQALRKLCAITSSSRTAVVFINQLREKVGGVYGSLGVTPGGRALKFFATVRIDLRITGALKDGSRVVGNSIRARVVKNKLAPPFREARFDIIFGRGISREGELLDLGTELGLVEKKGNWYQWDGKLLGQGYDKARDFLTEHCDISQQIEATIRHKALPATHVAGVAADYGPQEAPNVVELGNNDRADEQTENVADLFDLQAS